MWPPERAVPWVQQAQSSLLQTSCSHALSVEMVHAAGLSPVGAGWAASESSEETQRQGTERWKLLCTVLYFVSNVWSRLLNESLIYSELALCCGVAADSSYWIFDSCMF